MAKIKPKYAAILLILLYLIAVGIWAMFKNSEIPYPSVQEYVAGQGNIKGNVKVEKFTSISENFAIGANRDGYAVFKDPYKAFDTFVVLYEKGINRTQEEYGLSDISYTNYADYKHWGWYLKWATDKEREQGYFIVEFLDIYENSFIGK